MSARIETVTNLISLSSQDAAGVVCRTPPTANHRSAKYAGLYAEQSIGPKELA